MSKIERSIVIDRSREDVFAFVHNTANDVAWQTTLVESEPLHEAPLRPGAVVREVRRFLGVKVVTIRELTTYAPPRASSFANRTGPVPYSGCYRFEAVDGGTKVTATGEIEGGFFKLAEPVFARIAGRELETSLAHLKDILEAN